MEVLYVLLLMAHADAFSVSSVFGSNMVMQRGTTANGKARAAIYGGGERATVAFAMIFSMFSCLRCSVSPASRLVCRTPQPAPLLLLLTIALLLLLPQVPRPGRR